MCEVVEMSIVSVCLSVNSAMRFGRVDTLGQYISEFDPEPDSGKKGFGTQHFLTTTS